MLEGRSFRSHPPAHNGIYEAIDSKSPVRETSFRVRSTTGTGMADGMKKLKERRPMLLECIMKYFICTHVRKEKL